ncbi:unnamed protein product [Vitrella brassicaformis CCMP3155]|uniref:BZIP domain-containing protein n=2 Tax=Vitrella brassicaformis TaxID=1169539 RepID=A0A0G4EF51_VITBC|nr:unnamed protein product [Vitrella brassicaformis CCMP3155]|eukprot:CEL94591.1 unnamed protein product [Vitrella brassicaformis CCMP3155]
MDEDDSPMHYHHLTGSHIPLLPPALPSDDPNDFIDPDSFLNLPSRPPSASAFPHDDVMSHLTHTLSGGGLAPNAPPSSLMHTTENPSPHSQGGRSLTANTNTTHYAPTATASSRQHSPALQMFDGYGGGRPAVSVSEESSDRADRAVVLKRGTARGAAGGGRNVDEIKKQRKRDQNRASAVRSRAKKKEYYTSLEHEVEALRHEATSLRAENQLLKQQLSFLQSLVQPNSTNATMRTAAAAAAATPPSLDLDTPPAVHPSYAAALPPAMAVASAPDGVSGYRVGFNMGHMATFGSVFVCVAFMTTDTGGGKESYAGHGRVLKALMATDPQPIVWTTPHVLYAAALTLSILVAGGLLFPFLLSCCLSLKPAWPHGYSMRLLMPRNTRLPLHTNDKRGGRPRAVARRGGGGGEGDAVYEDDKRK